MKDFTYIIGGDLIGVTKGNYLSAKHNNGIYTPVTVGLGRTSKAWEISKTNKLKKIGEDYPRVQYDNNEPYLLIEPQVTNLVHTHHTAPSRSGFDLEYITASGPYNEDIPVTRCYNISTSNTRLRIVHFGTTTGFSQNTNYTVSFWVKLTSGPDIQINPRIGPERPNFYDISVADGWVFIEDTINSGTSIVDFADTGFNLINGDITSELLVTGMNLKQEDYPTSSIYNVGGSTTRARDTSTSSLNPVTQNLLGSTSGTIYANYLSRGGLCGILIEPNGANAIMLISSGEYTRVFLKQDSSTVYNFIGGTTGFNKVVVSYDYDSFIITINGVVIVETTIGYSGSWANTFRIGNYEGMLKMKEVKLYNRKLSKEEAILLSS